MRRSSRRREAARPTRRGAARKQVFTATVSSALLLFFVYKVRFEPEIIRSYTRDRTRTRKTGREAEPPSPFKSSWENRGGGGFREKGRRRGNGDDDEEDEEGRGGGSGLAHRRRGPCAPRSGLVSSGLLGTLGDNLFEMGFANRASVELCWDVSYTNSWRSKVFLDRGRRCFPNSFLPPLGGRDGRGNLGGPEDRGSDRYLELGDLPPELGGRFGSTKGGRRVPPPPPRISWTRRIWRGGASSFRAGISSATSQGTVRRPSLTPLEKGATATATVEDIALCALTLSSCTTDGSRDGNPRFGIGWRYTIRAARALLLRTTPSLCISNYPLGTGWTRPLGPGSTGIYSSGTG